MPSTNRFCPSTVRALAACGYAIDKHNHRADLHLPGGVQATVTADCQWRVMAGARKVAEGTETHPALAACDANEVAWKERDRIRAETRSAAQ